jgi:hypothetical protein
MEREKIEDFLTNTWEPLFLENFLGTSQVLQQLQNVSAIDDFNRNNIQVAFASYLTDASEAKEATDAVVNKLNSTRKNEGSAIRSIVSDFVEDDQIDACVIHITSLLGTDEPARIIFEFAEAAHIEMNNRRRSLLAPLEQAQAETVAELSAAYAELISGHSTITGRLEAAAKVTEQQDQLLGTLGINKTTKDLQAKLVDLTTKVDEALSSAGKIITTDSSGNIVSPNSVVNELLAKLQKINTPAETN